ncbi:MAG TPA: hypothetical protein VFQ53_29070 [Kofleriaceae bacterium]|nr:hypothetical protein [Kofleriaceae bacterium]
MLGGTGCKNKSDDASAAPDPAALKAQQELEAKRNALMEKRQKLQEERDRLDAQIQQVSATGGDTSELAKQRAALDTQIETQSSDLSSLSTKLDQVVARGDAAAGIAAREASMSSREKAVATREEKFAERERVLAQREAALAQREKETCGAAQPMIIQQVAPPKGGAYTRKDIEPLLGKARAQMAKKGIQNSDLGPASGLESEATSAMKDNDWGKAYLAAAQLVATVDAIKIDRAFITAKYSRLNNRVNSAKVDEGTKQQLTEGMKEVLQKYGDGDFTAANRKLNQLSALVK